MVLFRLCWLIHCHGPFFVLPHSLATINYTEHYQSVYEAKVLVIPLIQAVTDGGRLQSQSASRRSRLSFFLQTFHLKMAAIKQRIVGQVTQSAKDICFYKGAHIAAIPDKPPRAASFWMAAGWR